MYILIYAVIYRKKEVNCSVPIPSLRNGLKCVCVHLKENNLPRGNKKKAVELLLCLPGRNASIGRVFSRMSYI
jgi:hypothetical protein